MIYLVLLLLWLPAVVVAEAPADSTRTRTALGFACGLSYGIGLSFARYDQTTTTGWQLSASPIEGGGLITGATYFQGTRRWDQWGAFWSVGSSMILDRDGPLLGTVGIGPGIQKAFGRNKNRLLRLGLSLVFVRVVDEGQVLLPFPDLSLTWAF